jgi:CheY-like chemotaxis protein
MTKDDLNVLVVDDDMMARMAAIQCLKQQGHSAVGAEGGTQGLEILESQAFDLILLDLLMPDVDGFEVLRQLKARNLLQKTPVIIISASDEKDSIAKCFEMGATGHLRKPLDPASLADQIDACLASGS